MVLSQARPEIIALGSSDNREILRPLVRLRMTNQTDGALLPPPKTILLFRSEERRVIVVIVVIVARQKIQISGDL